MVQPENIPRGSTFNVIASIVLELEVVATWILLGRLGYLEGLVTHHGPMAKGNIVSKAVRMGSIRKGKGLSIISGPQASSRGIGSHDLPFCKFISTLV